MCKVDSAGAVDWRRSAVFGPDKILRSFNSPRLPPIETACLELILRFLRISRVTHRHHFELRRAKANYDLITPTPDAVIRRPSSKSPTFPIDDGLRHDNPLLSHADRGKKETRGVKIHRTLHQNSSFNPIWTNRPGPAAVSLPKSDELMLSLASPHCGRFSRLNI